MSNTVALLDKAQISLDSLQKQDYLKVLQIINSLATFPSNPSLRVHKLNLKNYFVARAGIKYRIIFKYQDDEITITDIVNHDRLERLYGSKIKTESVVETA
jgi:mRNA-degrading endonuclease RelE of RelBE toxin-antitoxin system